MDKIYVTSHCRGRIYKRLRKIGIKNVDIKEYIKEIVFFVSQIPNRYIKKPVKFRGLKWLHGFFDVVVVDDYFRNLRKVITIIF